LLEPDPPIAGLVPAVMDYVPGSGLEGLYFRYEQPGQLLAGLHTEEPVHDPADPDNFSRETDGSSLDRVAERFLTRFPGHDASRVAPGWAGLYPMTPDRMALVGPTNVPGFHVCGGAGGSGVQSSPAYGRVAADSVSGTTSLPFIAAALRPDRLGVGAS
jgi:glycine/D-amino acid oxidase-like deaminating enzyme